MIEQDIIPRYKT